MSRPQPSVKRALLLVALLALGVLVWRPIKQTMAVIALQNTVKRTNEVEFDRWEWDYRGRSSVLPEWVDRPICMALDRWFEDDVIADGNRFNIQKDRFQ